MQLKSTKPTKSKKKVSGKELLDKVNLPKIICIHLIGKNHTLHHRMGAGVILMTIGVMISKSAAGISVYLVSFVGDMIGYLIHGIGTLPFGEALVAHIQAPTPDQNIDNQGSEDPEGIS